MRLVNASTQTDKQDCLLVDALQLTAAATSSVVVGQAGSIDLRLQTAQERGTTATSRARLHFASIILSLTISFTRVNPFQLPSLRVIQFAVFLLLWMAGFY